jgi:glycosyltransferase involved in cell wall biosynthesis
MPKLQYALVTPARNEANYIEKTILSVVAQRYKPLQWVIVNDGSSDTTAETVAKYADRFDFIKLVQLSRTHVHNFASKVHAFNAGLQTLANLPYDLIGNLDADISLGAEYYANIIAEFEADSGLGIAGGAIYIHNGADYVTHDFAWDSVGGAVQLFRRECFQQTGGYMPMEGGGIDAAAEIMARMYGWSVRKVPKNPVYEQRRTGYAHGPQWKALYKEGVQYHRLGYSPLFYCFRSARRFGVPPLVLGSVAGLAGYLHAKVRRDPIRLPPVAVSYLRSEQLGKIRHALRNCRIPRAYY